MLRLDRRAKLLNAFRARRRRNYKREYRHPAFSARIVSMRCTSLCRTDKPEAHRNRVLKTVQRLTSGSSKLPGMDRAELPTIVQRTRLELVAARGDVTDAIKQKPQSHFSATGAIRPARAPSGVAKRY
jgi:hypothetical protein